MLNIKFTIFRKLKSAVLDKMNKMFLFNFVQKKMFVYYVEPVSQSSRQNGT